MQEAPASTPGAQRPHVLDSGQETEGRPVSALPWSAGLPAQGPPLSRRADQELKREGVVRGGTLPSPETCEAQVRGSTHRLAWCRCWPGQEDRERRRLGGQSPENPQNQLTHLAAEDTRDGGRRPCDTPRLSAGVLSGGPRPAAPTGVTGGLHRPSAQSSLSSRDASDSPA